MMCLLHEVLNERRKTMTVAWMTSVRPKHNLDTHFLKAQAISNGCCKSSILLAHAVLTSIFKNPRILKQNPREIFKTLRGFRKTPRGFRKTLFFLLNPLMSHRGFFRNPRKRGFYLYSKTVQTLMSHRGFSKNPRILQQNPRAIFKTLWGFRKTPRGFRKTLSKNPRSRHAVLYSRRVPNGPGLNTV